LGLTSSPERVARRVKSDRDRTDTDFLCAADSGLVVQTAEARRGRQMRQSGRILDGSLRDGHIDLEDPEANVDCANNGGLRRRLWRLYRKVDHAQPKTRRLRCA